jgi:hypothetical protein
MRGIMAGFMNKLMDYFSNWGQLEKEIRENLRGLGYGS